MSLRIRMVTAVACGLVLAGCSDPIRPSPPPENILLPPQPPPPQQGFTISGVITGIGPSGPMPLDGASVHDQYTHMSAKSSADGSYTLSGLGASVVLDVSMVGYRRHESSITLQGNRQIDVELIPSP